VPSNPSQSITRDLRVLLDIDPLKCKPNFRHTNLLVNAQFQTVQLPANYARYYEPACNVTAYEALAADYINTNIPLLSDTSLSPDTISKIAAELDAISLSDAYYSCFREVRQLLVRSESSVTSSTTECLNDSPGNSCCQLGYSSQAFDWDTCCAKHTASDLQATYTQPASLDGVCADASCVDTYVRDYTFASKANCRSLRTDANRFSFAATTFWGTCSESIYGRNLAGRSSPSTLTV